MDLLGTKGYKCSVSSVLNKDVKQHGKQYMFDGEDDTSWSSNEGTPQWITIRFDEPQSVSGFVFQFQGGFVGKNASICIKSLDGRTILEEAFYPEDINAIQKFALRTPIRGKDVSVVNFKFEASSDFFGRIIAYKLNLFE